MLLSPLHVIVQRLEEVLPDVPGPEQEEALHGEVGEGDDGHPGREDHLQQATDLMSVKTRHSVLCCLLTISRNSLGQVNL